ncbi:MAG: hypothetical protein HYV03_03555 [Deltaproteobacteria bacterium]|nr:hypothetical protein [Deltaproteobacteria bacterium]
MHRTTIILAPGLEQRLKKRARREGRSLTDLIQAFLRAALNVPALKKTARRITLPSFAMGPPRVDPADRSRLWDIMDEK